MRDVAHIVSKELICWIVHCVSESDIITKMNTVYGAMISIH